MLCGGKYALVLAKLVELLRKASNIKDVNLSTEDWGRVRVWGNQMRSLGEDKVDSEIFSLMDDLDAFSFQAMVRVFFILMTGGLFEEGGAGKEEEAFFATDAKGLTDR